MRPFWAGFSFGDVFGGPREIGHSVRPYIRRRSTRQLGVDLGVGNEVHDHGVAVPGGDQRVAVSAEGAHLCQKLVLLRHGDLVLGNIVDVLDHEISATDDLVLPPIVGGGGGCNTATAHVAHVGGIGVIEADVGIGILVENDQRIADIVVDPPVVGGGDGGVRILGSSPESGGGQLIFGVSVQKVVARDESTRHGGADRKT